MFNVLPQVKKKCLYTAFSEEFFIVPDGGGVYVHCDKIQQLLNNSPALTWIPGGRNANKSHYEYHGPPSTGYPVTP